jgi:threonine dehydrogenase-like Zn-dependent dehydrogenase
VAPPRDRAGRSPGDGHEYVGIVEEVGEEVENVEVGDFVVGSFIISDNTCQICRSGFQSKCVHAEFVAQTIGTQAEKAHIPFADGTLVPTPGQPDPELIPSLLAASDVLGTGWYAAVAAEAGPGKTVAVVGDGAVGLMAILAATQLGARRIIAMSRHPQRQELARSYGATDIVEERGDEGVAMIRELTGGLGAHSVIEAVGTQESFMQAVGATRGGGHLGYVGVTRAGSFVQPGTAPLDHHRDHRGFVQGRSPPVRLVARPRWLVAPVPRSGARGARHVWCGQPLGPDYRHPVRQPWHVGAPGRSARRHGELVCRCYWARRSADAAGAGPSAAADPPGRRTSAGRAPAARGSPSLDRRDTFA